MNRFVRGLCHEHGTVSGFNIDTLVGTQYRAGGRCETGQLLTRRRRTPLDSLTPREREVLKLMAEGHDNTTIATTLVITERSVSKHIGNVFLKLGLPSDDIGHRRVLAVLAYLNNP